MTHNFLPWPPPPYRGRAALSSDVSFAWPVTGQDVWPLLAKQCPRDFAIADTEGPSEIWVVYMVWLEDTEKGAICAVYIGGVATSHDEAGRIMMEIAGDGFDGELFARKYPVNVALYRKEK